MNAQNMSTVQIANQPSEYFNCVKAVRETMCQIEAKERELRRLLAPCVRPIHVE